ncbi:MULTISPECIES: helix-turn-helix transcriptional regulator [unclassified Breznakia]|uniref:helix-turn-helix domain-containing protein n=1 Tax=unclassified Breznakia TaxID=2623764 RepID=UPI0024768C12|nr:MULTISPECIES: helix-turn-helix transcriptional regulator [unclassified Breznakia]MDH6367040.1 transcriptional regulator with XRE-family HTH domain [Breznakia sp. PH1-1]MDH6404188.1 transcriptional regulator with XRE-family HTH domain [Breznakia sp. PF1-11]MDH6411927.1 transcriptional regulator with XRE-family HTH domain [Breznakia sp. PFB1-11]MDH6414176.1 transcriptional regulator with XRE-family HTH domain [Breznakia sp. PFB1-14]MDH6418929.1 transcriptional regulator with XRE-family HTH do
MEKYKELNKKLMKNIMVNSKNMYSLYLEKKNLTPKQFAKKVNWNENSLRDILGLTVRKKEAKMQSFRLETIVRLAEALEVDIYYLLRDPEENQATLRNIQKSIKKI